MLTKYQYNHKTYSFVDSKSENISNENIFTIIVGKNGTGKSRLLSAIISEFLDISQESEFYKESELGFKSPNPNSGSKGKLHFKYRPEKIITASTSPFDRFPITKGFEQNEEYTYLGLRDLPSQNFGLAYISKIISSLLKSVQDNSAQLLEINNVLNYLGYSDRIRIKLEYKTIRRIADAIIDSDNPVRDFESVIMQYRTPFGSFNRKFFYEYNEQINDKKVLKFVELVKNGILPIRKRIINIEISANGIYTRDLYFQQIEDIGFLIQSGILRLKEVALEQHESGTIFSISDASSGEQCVVMGMLGIASQIKNNSLVCIDEPEICLHPEWQERYIRMLITTFRNYKGCHFVIATHSPQIISKLEASNCYVLTMETGKVVNANSLINNSADFQLANVFNSPGFRNEYLIRIAINMFTKVTTSKFFDEQDHLNFKILESQFVFLEINDPVRVLIIALKEMHEEYV
ncbi:AAA family ATPase [Hymenobacter ruber]